MSVVRILRLLRKDLRLGPRSPIFLYALILPVLITLLLQLIFGTLLDVHPRLGVVDAGGSAVLERLRSRAGLDVREVETVAELRTAVEADDLDGGLVLTAGFDEALRAGRRPPLELYLGGESLASDRAVVAVAAIGAMREVQGTTAPVEVEIDTLGDAEALPLMQRLVPAVILLPLLFAGLFVTALGIVQERERRTLDALLVTPVGLGDVLAAKAALGLLLALLMSFVTLALNDALGSSPLAILLAVGVAAVMAVEAGVVYGVVSRDVRTLYTLVKSLNIIFIGPAIFYLFPDWPQWIARLFPTWWILDPIFAIAVRGAGLAEVGWEIGVAAGICVALLPLVMLLARRMRGRLGAG